MAQHIDGPLYYERMGRTGPVIGFRIATFPIGASSSVAGFLLSASSPLVVALRTRQLLAHSQLACLMSNTSFACHGQVVRSCFMGDEAGIAQAACLLRPSCCLPVYW